MMPTETPWEYRGMVRKGGKREEMKAEQRESSRDGRATEIQSRNGSSQTEEAIDHHL